MSGQIDPTLPQREARYAELVERRSKNPPDSFATIAKDWGVKRQQVHKLFHKGGVKPTGRPRDYRKRYEKVVARLAQLQRRRLRSVTPDVIAYVDALIADTQRELLVAEQEMRRNERQPTVAA